MSNYLLNLSMNLPNNQFIYYFISRYPAIGIFTSLAIGFFPAQATVITQGCAANDFCTLAELDSNATITVGDKFFSNWEEILNTKNENGVPGLVNLADIQVRGIFQDSNAPGLEFMAINDALTVGNDGDLNLVFDFQVTVINPNQKIVDSQLELTLLTLETSDETPKITINESVGTAKGLSNLASKSVFLQINPLQGNLQDSALFLPQESVFIRKFIELEAPNNSLAEIFQFQQRFSQTTSEPSSILSIIGLIGLGLTRKYKKHKL